ncbi:MAG TPA: hypothetical protein VFV65_05495 [Gemmatimonadales bacterium]|nr:hypothetical protein [Gemmatimonadales bacterium]
MRRILAGLAGLAVAASPLPRFAAAVATQSPVSLREAGDSARAAWERRDLATFLAPAKGGRLLVTLPGGRESAPIGPAQARALLASYVQGTEEVTTTLQAARVVDSLQGYVELKRRYRQVGLPGDREAMILLGFRRGREIWVLTEVRIAP